ncbi:MAG: GntR family transcriptional regulator [Solirubrobacteraceae bacterium]|nr:GntR family transcriptional regulator [Solirubrobacteraceae bacterium]
MNIEGSIARTTVSDAVYRRLRDQILGSGAEAGAPLPSERTLSETFGVNRHAVREAIKRLQQAGLVTVVHGGATRVTDWRREGGPELLVAVASGLESGERTKLAQQIVEARAAVAGRLVTGAAGSADLDAGVAETISAAGEEAAVALYRDLWCDIAAASGNLAAQLTLNSLNAGLDALETEGLAVFETEAARTDEIASLVGALIAGDSAGANKAASDVFGVTTVQV